MAYGHPTHISAVGDYVVKTGQGRLDRVCINTKGTGPNFLTLLDGVDVSGPTLAVIDCANASDSAIVYDLQVARGVFARYTGGFPGDLTIVTD